MRLDARAAASLLALALIACRGDFDAAEDSETGPEGSETGPEPDLPGALCGDGVVDPGEACDDGNELDFDGCGVDCEPSGELAWERTFPGADGTLLSRANAVAVEGADLLVGGYRHAGPQERQNLWLARLGASDGAEQWVEEAGDSGWDIALGLVPGAQGELWCGGYWDQSGIVGRVDGGSGVLTVHADVGQAVPGVKRIDGVLPLEGDELFVAGKLDDGTGEDVWYAGLDPDGTVGWSEVFDGGANDDLAGIAGDATSHEVVLAGCIEDPDPVAWVRKVRSSDGAELWTRTFPGANGPSGAEGVARDGDANWYVAGWEQGQTGGQNAWLRKLGGDMGTEVWYRDFDGGNGDDTGRAVAVGAGTVVLAGESSVAGSGDDVFVRKLDPDGTDRGQIVHDVGGEADAGFAVALLGDGSVVAAGSADGGAALWVARFDP